MRYNYLKLDLVVLPGWWQRRAATKLSVGEKMYSGAKKVCFPQKKILTSRLIPDTTQHIYGRIYSVNFLSHTSEAAGGIPSAAFLRLNRFSSVIPLGGNARGCQPTAPSERSEV